MANRKQHRDAPEGHTQLKHDADVLKVAAEVAADIHVRANKIQGFNENDLKPGQAKALLQAREVVHGMLTNGNFSDAEKEALTRSNLALERTFGNEGDHKPGKIGNVASDIDKLAKGALRALEAAKVTHAAVPDGAPSAPGKSPLGEIKGPRR